MEVLGCMTGILALKRTDVRRHGDRPFTFRTGRLHPPQRKRDEGTMRQRERVIAQRRAGLLRGCGRGPCRRSVYRSTVRTDGDDVGKLALRRKVAGDVGIVGSVVAYVRKSLVRIEHKYLLAELSSNQVKRCYEVGIAADESNGINVVSKRIIEHVGRDIDIRPFLFQFDDVHSAVGGLIAIPAFTTDRRHPNLVSVVISFDDFKALDFRECTKVDSLAFNSFGVVWICSDTCGVEFDRAKYMVASYQCPRERKRVKPFCAMIVAEKPIVKVSPINVDVCFHLFKMLRPRPFRIGASPRIGRASRSDVNLLRGSMGIIPNPVGLRKRLDFPKTKIRATGANHR